MRIPRTEQPLHIALAFFALHVLIALWLPVFNDEAYYDLWADNLSLAYMDHPPMVAWMIALGEAVFGQTRLGLRAVCVAAMFASSVIVIDMARLLGAGTAQQRAAVLFYNLGVLIMALGNFATPDVPSVLFWITAQWLAIRAVRSSAYGPWVLAGAALGLGLLSKFTNVFLCIGLLGWLVFTAQGRSQWRGGRPFVAMLSLFAVLAPYLMWNAAHDWIGVTYQFGRVTATGWTPGFIGEYVLLLVLLPTPIVAYYAAQALRGDIPHKPMLIWSVAPLLVYFLYHASHAQVQANWLAPVHGTFALLAAAHLRARPLRRWQWFVTWALPLGVMALAFNPVRPLDRTDNPVNQTRGWPDVRAQIQAQIDSSGAQWIAVTTYGDAGQFARRFPMMPVYDPVPALRYFFRDPLPAPYCQEAPAILIERVDKGPSEAQTLFDTVGPASVVIRRDGGLDLTHYRVTPVQGLRDRGICAAGL